MHVCVCVWNDQINVKPRHGDSAAYGKSEPCQTTGIVRSSACVHEIRFSQLHYHWSSTGRCWQSVHTSWLCTGPVGDLPTNVQPTPCTPQTRLSHQQCKSANKHITMKWDFTDQREDMTLSQQWRCAASPKQCSMHLLSRTVAENSHSKKTIHHHPDSWNVYYWPWHHDVIGLQPLTYKQICASKVGQITKNKHSAHYVVCCTHLQSLLVVLESFHAIGLCWL